jgi:hypothetical protein
MPAGPGRRRFGELGQAEFKSKNRGFLGAYSALQLTRYGHFSLKPNIGLAGRESSLRATEAANCGRPICLSGNNAVLATVNR